MAEPFLSEIRLTSFSFAPRGWALCNGQLLPINQNQALFSLLGTTFGGDGRVNFALPDLRGRTPVHVGDGTTLGQRGGEEAHTLTLAELPAHAHLSGTGDQATSSDPAGAALASKPRRGTAIYAPSSNAVANGAAAAGGGQAHLNMQPYLVLSFVIALQGIFPSQN
jgi:microcystin-dependent protein